MKKYNYILIALIFSMLVSCGGNQSQNEKTLEDEIVQVEDSIASEVIESSNNAKGEAENAEEEIDELLKDI